jgi:5-methyltetrahydropteroyltriglutamate--homocysteine methyltransferase
VTGRPTDIIEHPELVAQRLARYARLVGAQNVIAGTDCGLAGRVGHPEIVWAKLEDLAAGALIRRNHAAPARPPLRRAANK